jgi:hypothetical protein
MYQSASRSNTALNSLCIVIPTIYDTADETHCLNGNWSCRRDDHDRNAPRLSCA